MERQMERADKNLAFMLQYENIAWYENGKVRILDRRIYPTKVEFVECTTHQEVTKAITDMVTQSAGPYTAAAMGMALAAYECRNMNEAAQKDYLRKAAYTISHARPSTVDRMVRICEGCYQVAEIALASGIDVPQAIVDHTVRTNNDRYNKIKKIAKPQPDAAKTEAPKAETQESVPTPAKKSSKDGLTLDQLMKADLGMLSDEELEKGIKVAADAEEYKLASKLRDELKGRKDGGNNG